MIKETSNEIHVRIQYAVDSFTLKLVEQGFHHDKQQKNRSIQDTFVKMKTYMAEGRQRLRSNCVPVMERTPPTSAESKCNPPSLVELTAHKENI